MHIRENAHFWEAYWNTQNKDNINQYIENDISSPVDTSSPVTE